MPNITEATTDILQKSDEAKRVLADERGEQKDCETGGLVLRVSVTGSVTTSRPISVRLVTRIATLSSTDPFSEQSLYSEIVRQLVEKPGAC